MTLFEIVKAKNHQIQPLLFAHYVQKIFDLHPNHILAVMAYGSYLNETTKSSTSTPDFYVIVETYKEFYQSGWHSFLNKHLPPNIYHLNTGQGECKYCVISMDDLEKEVSPKTKDAYQLGRFSKRMGLVWKKNNTVEDRVTHVQVQAILGVSKKVLLTLPSPFSLNEFTRQALYLSYQADVRIESIDKVDKILDSEKTYYHQIFSQALEDLQIQKTEDGKYDVSKSSVKTFFDQVKFNKFIFSSKLRAQAHWPKNMLTVDNWLDYMLAKIERTQGIKIEMSPKERKYWYLYGWKYFRMLSKKKLIK